MKAFENLRYQHIKTLLEVVNSSKERNIEVIKQRHRSISDNFQGAMEFLQKLQILNEKNGQISIKKAFQVTMNVRLSDSMLRRQLLNELLSTKSVLSRDIQGYLDKFDVVRDTFEYKPNTALRIKESGVRNLFMELDFIEYNRNTGTYRIKERHFDSFAFYLNRKKISPEELTHILKWKDDLGKAAELEVLQYEKERLAKYPEFIQKIEHTARKDVLAGYDILSWEIEYRHGNVVPRFIEVKAISIIDNNFYWTRNEVEVAKRLVDRYYLYLLPAIGDKQFNLGALVIIPDPINMIFNNSPCWDCQVETYSFRKKV